MPDFPLIDSHVHLYDVARHRYGWLAGVPAINRTHLLAAFDAATAGVAIEAIVFAEVAVDPGLHLAEAAFVQALADHEPRLRGMVAHAPLERGADVEADLAALAAHPTLRGVRRLLQTESDLEFCLRPEFVEGVRRAGRHGLVVDLCVKHPGLRAATELARRCPDVAFVLDHIGKPGIAAGLREPWWTELRAMAALPNVTCKVSGVITEADHARWTPAEVEPYAAHAIDCFGFERVMFGSDWPVSTLTHQYAEWVAIVDGIVSGASDAEKRALFAETARRVYRLSPAAQAAGSAASSASSS